MSWAWLAAIALGLGGVTYVVKRSLAPGATTQLDTAGGTPPPWWTAADYRTLNAMCKRLGINPADMLLIMYSESRLDPSAAYKGADGTVYAAGLNQITASGGTAAGLSPAEVQDLIHHPVSYQLPIIERMYKTVGGKYPNAAVLYAYNFAPSRVKSRGTAPSVVLYSADTDGKNYSINSGFDAAKKGYITIADMGYSLVKKAQSAVYKGALQALRNATGDQSISPNLGV